MTSPINEKPGISQHERVGSRGSSDVSQNNQDPTDVNEKLANPLAGLSSEQVQEDAVRFANNNGLAHLSFENLSELTAEDKEVFRREITHKWDQPKMLYFLVGLCSLAAAVQGMDESVVNSAQLFFAPQFGVNTAPGDPNASQNQWILGIINSAPYLCCAILGCWLTDPLNYYLGRRGTIFVAALLSGVTCIWQGVTNSWPHLFVARFVLGLGIGPKSTTVPIFAAESTPAPIRGALVMMWQMWTAFGIMLGFIVDLGFYFVQDHNPHIKGLKWRLMLGSAGIPGFIVMALVYLVPESPRWYLSKGRVTDAYKSLEILRGKPLLAARDLYYIHVLLEAEKEFVPEGRTYLKRFTELFTVPRNRRAALASWVVMFMQQFCGINVIAYYSSSIFTQSGFSNVQALAASVGFGAINFVFAFPAVLTIDSFGRRSLLLLTFPLMAICLLFTGFCFWIPEEKTRIGFVALGIYVFTIFYSLGEGPVPFTYSAEAYPLIVRDVGMSFATATTWFFNFIVSITFPRLLGAFKPQGAFGWYAGWNAVGFMLILLFVPETKSLSLEELDQVFNVPTHLHAGYALREVPIWFKRTVLRQKDTPRQPPLYNFDVNRKKTYAPAAGGH
ncbi:hypothetical protein FRB96_001564 [Tulasnella sp. 330]|nr:hypothetical protein FRB96_001564 [Tulasnella sp. 330]KAG8880147.1 hypothetical protein FRB97_001036 [Tulasnella sp. 331]